MGLPGIYRLNQRAALRNRPKIILVVHVEIAIWVQFIDKRRVNIYFVAEFIVMAIVAILKRKFAQQKTTFVLNYHNKSTNCPITTMIFAFVVDFEFFYNVCRIIPVVKVKKVIAMQAVKINI